MNSCNDLFERFFLKWYSPDNLAQRIFPGLYADYFEFGEAEFESFSRLSVEGDQKVQSEIKNLTDVAGTDFGEIIGASRFDLDTVDALDKYFDYETILEIIENSEPSDNGNEYLVLCCEIGAFVGRTIIQKSVHDCRWFTDSPVWDSFLFNSTANIGVPLFHWAVKRMSSDFEHELLLPKSNMIVELSSK